ncbi:MAG: integrase core domain-containing protein [Akkermansia sp.]
MERFWRTNKHEFFLHRESKSPEDAIEMTSEWMEYYNRERPHSALKNCSPLMYRENLASPPSGEFLARFFRSGTARVALLRALATLGTPCLRYKIAPKMA